MNRPSPELVELCGAVRDESATPEQVARLETLLAGDVDARRFYRRFVQISAMLERYEQAPRLAQAATPPAAAPAAPPVRRVWRRRPLPQHGLYYWLAVAACFAVVALVSFRLLPDARDDAAPAAIAASSEAPVAYIQDGSGCLLIPRAGAPVGLSGGVEVRLGDIVATRTRGSAVIRFRGENTLFVLSNDTRVWLAQEGAVKIVHLSSGQLYGDVAPQTDGAQWRIITAHGEARVLGTRLAVSAGTEGTHVAVTAGRVRVTARDTRQSVDTAAGFGAQLTPTTATLVKLDPAEPTAVTSFTLVDADTNAPVAGFERLADGAILDLATLPSRRLNIQANCEPQLVGMVRFQFAGVDPGGTPLTLVQPISNGFPNQIEIFYPYMLAGDPSVEGERLPQHSYAWAPQPGRYTLTATPYAGKRQWGARGQSLTVQFEVVDSAAVP